MHGAGHDIARRKLRQWMHRRHEALAAFVHEECAVAPDRLREQRGRIAPDIESGRVELDELRIGDNRAGARGHGKPAALRLRRVGRNPVKLADAAGRQDNRAARQERGPARFARPPHIDASDASLLAHKLHGFRVFEHRYRGGRGNSGDQRGHHSLASPVAADAHDPARAMRRLLRQAQLALKVAVEGHAIAQQILDALPGFESQNACHFGIGKAGARGNRIGGMGLRRVALAYCRGDSALRPGRGRALAQRLRAQHRDRQRRKPQRREQPRQAAANDQHAMRPGAALKLQWLCNKRSAHGFLPARNTIPTPAAPTRHRCLCHPVRTPA